MCNLTTMGLHAMEQRQKKKSGTTLQFYYFFVRIIIYMSYFLISHLHDRSIPGTAVTFLGDMIIHMFAITYGQIYVLRNQTLLVLYNCPSGSPPCLCWWGHLPTTCCMPRRIILCTGTSIFSSHLI